MKPKELENSYYFEDMGACPIKEAFENVHYPWEALTRKERIFRSPGTELHGNIHPSAVLTGNVRIGKNSVIHPNVVIEGPVSIGEGCEIRSSALIRSGTVIGNRVIVGHCSEVKNSIIFDDAKIASNVFVGDSILGKGSRIGSGSITGNRRFDQKLINVRLGEENFPTDRDKFSCVIGEYSRVGANCSTAPGTMVGKHTWISGNSLLYGLIPSDKLVKAKTEFEMIQKERLYLQRADSRGKV